MKHILLSALFGLMTVSGFAQSDSLSNAQLDKRIRSLEQFTSKLNKLKFSGYIQADWTVSQTDAWINAGILKPEGEGNYNRLGIRRGRVKMAYKDIIGGVKTQGVFQIDATEKGISVKDVYFAITEPWTEWITLQAGLFNRPFGYEIGYSSSQRESPERSTATLTLFPNEREVGAMLQVQSPNTQSVLNRFTLQAGLFNGNGPAQDMDNRKDLITRLSYSQPMKNSSFGAGVSFYYGGVYQGTENIYEMQGNEFVKKEGTQIGDYSNRIYYGADAQYSLKTPLGTTHLRGEIITGQQPGSSDYSISPKGSTLPGHDIYLRHFFGCNFYFIQDILKSRHSLVVKYDSYDPNTAISGEEVGQGGSGRGDIAQSNLGVGYLFRMTSAVRLMAYYNLAFNEEVSIPTYGAALKDNVFTLRLQYKF